MGDYNLLSNLDKNDWTKIYKKLNNEYKIEEKNIMQQILNEDFHMLKIFTGYNDEIENERKFLFESSKQLKKVIQELSTSNNSMNTKSKKADNIYKIYKIEELINRNKLEYKNRFIELLNEEDQLENELNNFEIEYGRIENLEPLIIKEPVIKQINNFLTEKQDQVDEYITYIMNSANIAFNEYSEDVVDKLIRKLENQEAIKKKSTIIDYIIDKNLNGTNLGWQTREHQDFLRLVAQHQGKVNTFEFIDALEGTLPFLPRSELKNHIKQFNKYKQLIELKKLLIIRYKELKIDKDIKIKSNILNDVNEDKSEDKKMKFEKNKIYNEQQKQKLEKWKLQKQKEEKEKYEEELKQENLKIEKERLRLLEKANKIKPLIEEYKKQKDYNKHQKNLTKIENNFEKISEIDLERINEKNLILLEKKKSIINSKSISLIKNNENYTKYKLKKMEILENIKPKIQDKTEGSNNKIRNKHDYVNNKSADSMAGNVLGKMTRAVPIWRKGLI